MKIKTTKQTVKRIIKIILAFFVVCIFLTVALCGLQRERIEKYRPFIKQKTEYDVLFLGSSHIINSCLPRELWNNFGITSYNLGEHSCKIIEMYSMLRLACAYHKPKVVVIDILGLNTNRPAAIAPYHKMFDEFPLSAKKVQVVCEMQKTRKEKFELLFPFALYHGRWNELSWWQFMNATKKRLQSTESIRTKGEELRIDVQYPHAYSTHKEPYNGQESQNMVYLRKLIRFCHQNNIIPLVTIIPFPLQNYLEPWKAPLFALLQEENAAFVSLSNIGIDFDTDLYDQDSHLNPAGAKKVSATLGVYFLQNTPLTDRRTSATTKSEQQLCEQWNTWAKNYDSYLNGRIRNLNSIKQLLLMADFCKYRVELQKSPSFAFDATEQKLLLNLGGLVSTTESAAAQDYDLKIQIFEPNFQKPLTEKKFKNTLSVVK